MHSHGITGYKRHRCRCEVCRAANRIHHARYVDKAALRADKSAHGASAYTNRRCRCDICKAAKAAHNKLFRRPCAHAAGHATMREMCTPTNDNITLLAARAASILMQWAGLHPTRKRNGCETRVAAHIEATLRAQKASRHSIYYNLNMELPTLAIACDFPVTWPITSCLTICADGNDPGNVHVQQGHDTLGVTHSIVPNGGGWLITQGFSVDYRLRSIVADAVKSGKSSDAIHEATAT